MRSGSPTDLRAFREPRENPPTPSAHIFLILYLEGLVVVEVGHDPLHLDSRGLQTRSAPLD